MLSWRKNAPDQIPLADESSECILEFAGIQPRIISSSKLIDFRTIRFLAPLRKWLAELSNRWTRQASPNSSRLVLTVYCRFTYKNYWLAISQKFILKYLGYEWLDRNCFSVTSCIHCVLKGDLSVSSGFPRVNFQSNLISRARLR